MDERAAYQHAVSRFSDWRWRLDHLYWIIDKEGNRVRFQMNEAQAALFDGMHYLNLILKARQLGFTTFIQLFMLDACLFNSNVAAGTIAHTLDDAKDIFEGKVKYAYDQLPEEIRAANPAVEDSKRQFRFRNGSLIRVGTSLRSGTYQYLHVSEYGKICAQYPDKAREVKAGALNTVEAGQIVFIESTARGREGHFYELCRAAQKLQQQGAALTPLDFKLFFFPWWRHDSYRMNPEGVVITATDEQYFAELKAKNGIALSDDQRAWYAKKKAQQDDDMKQEFPSTPEEAFEASVEGAYYMREMARLREKGQITRVPWEPTIPVNTFWDLGIDDETVIWFHQQTGKEHRFIDYYANSGEGLGHYVQILNGKGYIYGQHFFPHDIEVAELGTGKTRRKTLEDLKVRNIRAVPRTQDVAEDIQRVRNILPSCWFDEANCAEGIKALDAYRKEWDERLGTFKPRPFHNWASHGADGFRTFAVGYRPRGDRRARYADADYDVLAGTPSRNRPQFSGSNYQMF